MDVWAVWARLRRLHLAHDQGAYFGPLPVQERDHRTINTEHQPVRTGRWWGKFVEEALGLGGLVCEQECPSSFSASARGIGMHVCAGEESQFTSRSGKRGDVTAQAYQRLLEPRREAAGQQCQFIIEGG